MLSGIDIPNEYGHSHVKNHLHSTGYRTTGRIYSGLPTNYYFCAKKKQKVHFTGSLAVHK